MGLICGRGIGGSTHELVRDDHVFVFVGAVNMHLARCRLFMG